MCLLKREINILFLILILSISIFGCSIIFIKSTGENKIEVNTDHKVNMDSLDVDMTLKNKKK
jgi:hypothetical protein